MIIKAPWLGDIKADVRRPPSPNEGSSFTSALFKEGKTQTDGEVELSALYNRKETFLAKIWSHDWRYDFISYRWAEGVLVPQVFCEGLGFPGFRKNPPAEE